MTDLERRIIDISYQKKLSHLSSNLCAVGIIDEIFSKKLNRDKFVLSCGHSGLSLYTVIEKYFGYNAEVSFDKMGVHPDRIICPDIIDCSTGSLGMGISIALGMAIADRSRKVFCLVSDGECAEGVVYESLNVKEKYKIDNLIVYCNFNGWGAYDETNLEQLKKLPGLIIVDTTEKMKEFSFLKGQESHYHVLTETEYNEATNA